MLLVSVLCSTLWHVMVRAGVVTCRASASQMIGPGGYAELEMDDPILDGAPPAPSSGPPAWALQNGALCHGQALCCISTAAHQALRRHAHT